jgi:hypothetical protein
MAAVNEKAATIRLTESEVLALTGAMDAVSSWLEARRWKKEHAATVDALNEQLGLQSYRLKKKLGDAKHGAL